MPPAVMPGLLTLDGSGTVDVAHDGTRALLAMLERGVRFVRYWTPAPAPGAWVNLGGTLNEAPASGGVSIGGDLLSIAIDASGAPWVAFSEVVGGARNIYVKRFDSSGGAWVLVGGVAAAGPDADQPSIAFVGGVPHVAYVRTVGGVDRVFVRRFVGGIWQALGGPVDPTPAVSAVAPDLVDIAGTPYVALREPAMAAGAIHVVRLP